MRRGYIGAGGLLLAAVLLVSAAAIYLSHANLAVLNPAGTISSQERGLIIFAALLSLIVVIPVFGLTIGIAWRYREGNPHAAYAPMLAHNRVVETIWWLVPSALILTLSIVAWHSSHTLDPRQSLASAQPPLTIQVVALDWKWLFIYPQQSIATVNYVQLPVNRPVNFEITADAPMNSFWIPQLGGQIYAMPGMSTQLNLMASRVGEYRGLSANISGTGFAGMTFTAKASSQADFDRWAATTRQQPAQLTAQTYQQLATPSQNVSPRSYSLASSGIYDSVINKYMVPGEQLSSVTGVAP